MAVDSIRTAQRLGQAAAALAAGVACYLWLRPTLGVGVITGSMPAFTHALGFALLLMIAARPRTARARAWLLGAWLALLLFFEALQGVPALPIPDAGGELLRAHARGVFDFNDVIASVLGVALAAHLAPATTDEAS